jgi:hypothetical protein
MCEFASWKEYKGKVYFIKDTDLNTKEGKKLLKPEVIADICGHGAIENYYPELAGQGFNKECTDFSTTDNFPKEVVRAIKSGKLTRFGISLQLLNDKGQREYEKVKGPALAEYEKVRGQAAAEYEKVKGPAWAEYEKVRGPAFWKIFKDLRNRNELWR